MPKIRITQGVINQKIRGKNPSLTYCDNFLFTSITFLMDISSCCLNALSSRWYQSIVKWTNSETEAKAGGLNFIFNLSVIECYSEIHKCFNKKVILSVAWLLVVWGGISDTAYLLGFSCTTVSRVCTEWCGKQANKCPTIMCYYYEAILSTWTTISKKCFQHIVKSMSQTIQAVLSDMGRGSYWVIEWSGQWMCIRVKFSPLK